MCRHVLSYRQAHLGGAVEQLNETAQSAGTVGVEADSTTSDAEGSCSLTKRATRCRRSARPSAPDRVSGHYRCHRYGHGHRHPVAEKGRALSPARRDATSLAASHFGLQSRSPVMNRVVAAVPGGIPRQVVPPRSDRPGSIDRRAHPQSGASACPHAHHGRGAQQQHQDPAPQSARRVVGEKRIEGVCLIGQSRPRQLHTPDHRRPITYPGGAPDGRGQVGRSPMS